MKTLLVWALWLDELVGVLLAWIELAAALLTRLLLDDCAWLEGLLWLEAWELLLELLLRLDSAELLWLDWLSASLTDSAPQPTSP